ncbi:unnamed protein product [Chironomus riparius]|uniref:Ionotropic glutamate receptor C-terminal domain-containing protein n=1 Tax=Chironomus riparius TaxID=315576 RepID=A0A9N9RP79_9DIPT|nr:unnamed protein product [Chironomus riparius]
MLLVFVIVYLCFLNLIIGKFALNHHEVGPISKVLFNVADEFLVKQKISFNIFAVNIDSTHSWDVLSDFMKNNNEQFKYILFVHRRFDESHRFFMTQTNILFVPSLNLFYILEKSFKIILFNDRPSKFIVYIPNLTFDDLESFLDSIYYPELNIFSGSFIHFSFFITNEAETVTLSTFEWFSSNECNNIYLKKLNVFDKKSLKWRSELKNYEKFLNYHGCELVMMLPLVTLDSVNYHPSGYILKSKSDSNDKMVGITPIIFEITSQFHNFTTDFQGVQMDDSWENVENPTEIVESNNTDQKITNVYFEVLTMYNIYQGVATSNVVANHKVLMFVTPAEKYTQYEKFFLPFDLQTWILVSITFVLTFVMIFVINLLSKSVQSLFYGQNVDTPIWNVISIFFGISQTELPTKNFSRFILVLFIYFCLIFRTCFQSKFFEFLTSEPRRSPPESIDDLIDRGYSVLTMSQTFKFCSNTYRKELWPNIKVLSPNAFDYAHFKQASNSSAKIALCIDEFYHDSQEFIHQKNFGWNQLKDTVLYTTYDVFLFIDNSFYFQMFKKVINDLIPTGIMNHLIEYNYTKKIKFDKIEKEPQVLNVDDLLFGFKI